MHPWPEQTEASAMAKGRNPENGPRHGSGWWVSSAEALHGDLASKRKRSVPGLSARMATVSLASPRPSARHWREPGPLGKRCGCWGHSGGRAESCVALQGGTLLSRCSCIGSPQSHTALVPPTCRPRQRAGQEGRSPELQVWAWRLGSALWTGERNGPGGAGRNVNVCRQPSARLAGGGINSWQRPWQAPPSLV